MFSCFKVAPRFLLIEPTRKNQLQAPSTSMDLSSQQMIPCVKIILAGGLVEMYQKPILASQVIAKYPGMCVARPEVFNRPHDSVVRPDEKLQLGQKFYLVPYTTLLKLKQKVPAESPVKGGGESKAEDLSSVKNIIDGDFEESYCSAKDFYISREKWATRFLKECGTEGEKKIFTPPIKRPRTWSRMEWQPRLSSVKEISP